MEGDLLIFALLILGACCAGNGYGSLRKDLLPALRARTGAIPLQRQEAGGIMAWVLLVLVALIAMATVAKRPSEGEPGLVLAPLLHGALWAAAGAALCLLAAAPMFA
ncbi:unnamed protein product [Effrenium voratum]|nr:unnamed protein product [Effrenium voratum]